MRKVVTVVCSTVFVICLAAFPVMDYVGGRLGRPFPGPAEFVPLGIGFFAAVILITVVMVSLIVRQDRAWTIGALAIVLAATGAFVLSGPYMPGFLFLHGLRDRFVTQVGYSKMRDFAREVSQEGFPLGLGGSLQKPGMMGEPVSEERQKQWDDLADRYPFLEWPLGAGTVTVGADVVELTWRSHWEGQWGFQVAPNGKVGGAIEEDRGRVLKVADDIQFVYYYFD